VIERSKVGRRPVLAGGASALAIAPLVTAPRAARAAEKITLTFANWADAEGATRPGIQKIIADFEKAHPTITIKSEAISFSEIARQLVLRVRAGNPPDIAELAGNDTILLALTGKLENLNSFLEAKEKTALKPSALTGLSMHGKLIAFPWTQAPAALWYNKALMQKAGINPAQPPQTIDALMAAMAAVKQKLPGVLPIGLDTTNRPFGMISNWPWMQTFGANPLDVAGKGAESPAMKAYLSWIRSVVQKGYTEPGMKIGDFRPMAAQDKLVFGWDQVLLQGVIQSINHMSDAAFYQHWGVAPLPAGPSGKSFSFDGGHQLVMFSASTHKAAAWTFINYLATSANAIRNYTIKYESSLMPLKQAPSPDLAKMLDTPVFNTFADKIMPTVTMPPFGPGFAAGSTAVMAGVQQAVTGNTPIDSIAQSIQQNLAEE
jgi:multiple sugar transport system substrate-binding protein